MLRSLLELTGPAIIQERMLYFKNANFARRFKCTNLPACLYCLLIVHVCARTILPPSIYMYWQILMAALQSAVVH